MPRDSIGLSVKESLLAYAEETKSVYQIAQAMGYKPRVLSAANAEVDVFQTVPAVGAGSQNRADLRYGQVLKAGSEFTATSGIKFYSSEDISFQ